MSSKTPWSDVEMFWSGGTTPTMAWFIDKQGNMRFFDTETGCTCGAAAESKDAEHDEGCPCHE